MATNGFLTGVMTVSKTGCGDGGTTVNLLKTIELDTLKGELYGV